MKNIYDFRPWQTYEGRGIARYIYDLYSVVIKKIQDDAYILIDRKKTIPKFEVGIEKKIYYFELKDLSTNNIDEPFDFYLGGSAHDLGVKAADVLSVMYPQEVLSLCKFKCTIIYDFIPLYFNQHIYSLDRKISFGLQTEMIKKLDHLFCISMFTLASAVKYSGRDPSAFTCLYGGANEKKFMTANSYKKYKDTKRANHIVHISGDAPQKNNDTMIKSFCRAYKDRIIPDDSKLYIVCKASEQFKNNIMEIVNAEGCIYGKHVEATGFISDSKMLRLLTTARASVFPSYVEGLGLPILESYVAGTPVWGANTSSVQELICKECSFDPFSIVEIKEALVDMYVDDKCEKSLEFGRQLLKTMNWNHCADVMIFKLNKLMDSKNNEQEN